MSRDSSPGSTLAAIGLVLVFATAHGAEPLAPGSGSSTDAPPAQLLLENATREEAMEALGVRLLDETSTTLNGFQVQSSVVARLGTDAGPDGRKSPTGVQLEDLTATAPGLFKVWITKGRQDLKGGSISVTQRDTSSPLLNSADVDGDGRLDFLEYMVVDTSGRPVVNVVDYDADGQADMRVHFGGERFTELWHADRWHRMQMRGEERGILLDGRFVALQRDANHRWVVPVAPR